MTEIKTIKSLDDLKIGDKIRVDIDEDRFIGVYNGNINGEGYRILSRDDEAILEIYTPNVVITDKGSLSVNGSEVSREFHYNSGKLYERRDKMLKEAGL